MYMKEFLLNGSLAQMSLSTTIFVFILSIWTIGWKGFALWTSSREEKKIWFIILLLINTFGILEIIYIYGFSQRGRACIRNWRHRRHKRRMNKRQREEAEEYSEDEI